MREAAIITSVGVFELCDGILIAPGSAMGHEQSVTLDTVIDDGEAGNKTVRELITLAMDCYGHILCGRDKLEAMLDGRIPLVR